MTFIAQDLNTKFFTSSSHVNRVTSSLGHVTSSLGHVTFSLGHVSSLLGHVTSLGYITSPLDRVTNYNFVPAGIMVTVIVICVIVVLSIAVIVVIAVVYVKRYDNQKQNCPLKTDFMNAPICLQQLVSIRHTSCFTCSAHFSVAQASTLPPLSLKGPFVIIIIMLPSYAIR